MGRLLAMSWSSYSATIGSTHRDVYGRSASDVENTDDGGKHRCRGLRPQRFWTLDLVRSRTDGT